MHNCIMDIKFMIITMKIEIHLYILSIVRQKDFKAREVGTRELRNMAIVYDKQRLLRVLCLLAPVWCLLIRALSCTDCS